MGLSLRAFPVWLSCALMLGFTVPAGLSAAAQDRTPAAVTDDVPASQEPAHIALVDGAAVLEREGRGEQAHAGVPLLHGDRLRTTEGRVEVLFPDGSTLYADRYTQVDFLSDDLARVPAGRVTIVLAGAGDDRREVRYQVDTPGGVARLLMPGEYRIALLDSPEGRATETVLAVVRGEAELSTEAGAVPVRAGERSIARDRAAPSFPLAFNSARLDAFDAWTEQRRRARTGAASTEYLPQALYAYGPTFDRYGAWRYMDPYGHVWFPHAHHDWRPYYDGYWSYLAPYGWTWISFDPWGWPTHHYGRWGRSSLGAWFWIPLTRWGAAWVSWATAPGYLAWCPLGWNNRPVFSFSVFASWHDPFWGWTVISSRSFRPGLRIHTVAVQYDHLRATRPAFVERPPAPLVAAREIAPLRAPTRRGGVVVGRVIPRSLAVDPRRSGGTSGAPGWTGEPTAPGERLTVRTAPQAPARSTTPSSVLWGPGSRTRAEVPDAQLRTPDRRALPRERLGSPGGVTRPAGSDASRAQPPLSETGIDRFRARPAPNDESRGWSLPRGPARPESRPLEDRIGEPRRTPRARPTDDAPERPAWPRAIPPRFEVPRATPPVSEAPRAVPRGFEAPGSTPRPYDRPRAAAPRYEAPRALPRFDGGPRPEPSAPPARMVPPPRPSGPPPDRAPDGGGGGEHRPARRRGA